MKPDIIKEFNLPPYIKNKTFAEASKAINKKFADRTDPTSNKTKEELMGRLAEAQEYIKMQEALKANSEGIPDHGTPEGFEDYAEGGLMQSAGGVGGMANDANTLMQFGQDAFGDSGIDTSGLAGRQEQVKGAGWAAAGAGLKGAAAGAKYGGPIGAAVGATVGVGSSLIGSERKRNDITEANTNTSLIENNTFRNDFAMGGNLNKKKKTDPTDTELDKEDVKKLNSAKGANGTVFTQEGANSLFKQVPLGQDGKPLLDFGKYADVGYFNIGNMEGDTIRVSNTKNNPHNAQTISQNMDYLREINPNKKIELDYNQFADGGLLKSANELTPATPKLATPEIAAGELGPKYKMGKQHATTGDRIKGGMVDAANWTKENYGDVLRTAPIVSNALQLKNLDKPKRESLDRLDSRYKTNYVDERALENRVQNEGNNISRSLAGASNGSLGVLRSNLLAAHLNKTNVTSDAYIKASDINRTEDRVAQQFNSGIDRLNLSQSNREDELNTRNDAAYQNNKSMLQSQLANDIGNFGKEKVNMQQVAEMYGYKWNGKYLVDSEGNQISLEEFSKKVNKVG